MNEKACPICGGPGRPSLFIAEAYECFKRLHRWNPAHETVRGLVLPQSGPGAFSELIELVRAEVTPNPWSFEYVPGATGRPPETPASAFGIGIDPGWIWDIKAEPRAPVEESEPDTGPPPVLEGSVIGYRSWRIDFKSWGLQGTGFNHGDKCWQPGVNEATCIHGCPVSPGAHCHCGFNALARFSDDRAWWSTADVNMHAELVGAIEAWSDETCPDDSESQKLPGRFFLHSTGFRAQYARVVLLAIQEDWPRAKIAAVKALAAEHGADICKRRHLASAAAEHGQLVPEELLQWARDREPAPVPDPPAGLAAYFSLINQAFFQALAPSAEFRESLLQTTSALEGLRERSGATLPTKGVSRKLKTPGPPGFGTFKEGDLVQDCKNRIYRCVKGGKGHSCSWEPAL